MPYTMDLHASGLHRHPTPTTPIAAAAITMTNKHQTHTTQTTPLPPTPLPTLQRAELTSIILALQQARSKSLQMRSPPPHMAITIYTSSKYAIGCMTEWSRKWARNGFRNRRGREVVNRDLIEEALGLEREVRAAGTVEWVWVPRGQNGGADAVVDAVLDEMERGCGDSDSDSPVW